MATQPVSSSQSPPCSSDGLRSHCCACTNAFVKCQHVLCQGPVQRSRLASMSEESPCPHPPIALLTTGSLCPFHYACPPLPSLPSTRQGSCTQLSPPSLPLQPLTTLFLESSQKPVAKAGPYIDRKPKAQEDTRRPESVPITSPLPGPGTPHCHPGTGVSAGSPHSCTPEGESPPALSHALRTKTKFVTVAPAPSSASSPPTAHLSTHTSCGTAVEGKLCPVAPGSMLSQRLAYPLLGAAAQWPLPPQWGSRLLPSLLHSTCQRAISLGAALALAQHGVPRVPHRAHTQ